MPGSGFIDFLGYEWPSECMGCLISNEMMDVPGGILCKSKHFNVIQDPLVPLPGFLVIGSNRHYQSLADMTNDEFSDYTSTFQRTRSVLREVFTKTLNSIIQEEHSQHFHTWFFPWTSDMIKIYPNQSISHIREIMNGPFRQKRKLKYKVMIR